GLIRIPQAFSKVLPIASLLLIIMVALGLYTHNLYHHWPAEGIAVEGHPIYANIVAGKTSYLNAPFCLTRLVFFLAIYSFFARLLPKLSNNEDLEGGLNNYKKSIKHSAIFLVIFGFTTPIWSFDTIMSLEAHWFS